ncbi:MAG: hypothetical protein ACOYXT_05590 [Bacteroidota bacterium]
MKSAEQAVEEVGEMGEWLVHICINPLASAEISPTAKLICTLEIGTSVR